jgi:hypothetical protein
MYSAENLSITKTKPNKTMTELEALQNACDNGLVVREYFTHDKRKTIKMYYATLNGNSISPVLDYENLNHFILGFNKAVKLKTQ